MKDIVKDLDLICEPDTMHRLILDEADIELPDDDSFIQAAIIFQQLSDSTRLKILWLLMQYEICVYDIANTLNMSAPAVSHHLKSLRQLEIINYKRDGKHMFYSLADNEDAEFIKRMIQDIFVDTDLMNLDIVKRNVK